MKMKKLLLTSDGFINPNIAIIFLELVNKNPKDIKVLFIPTASEFDGKSMTYLKDAEKELTGLGILKENVVWLNTKNVAAINTLDYYDAIYVCGGNTFYLASELKRTSFDKKVIELVNSGSVYVGVSAGTVIAGPDVSVADGFDPNDVGLKNVRGLSITEKVITPHYQKKDDKVIDEFERKNHCEVLRLNDGQALEEVDGISKIIE